MTHKITPKTEVKALQTMQHELCQCNQCETIMYDENPQVGAKQYDIVNNSTDGTKQQIAHMVKSKSDRYWCCPICLNDLYIQDL